MHDREFAGLKRASDRNNPGAPGSIVNLVFDWQHLVAIEEFICALPPTKYQGQRHVGLVSTIN
jgi:hypothetical protein